MVPVDSTRELRYAEKRGETMKEEHEPDVMEKKPPEPLPVDAEERWDNDVDLGPFPPPLRSTKISVRFRRKEPEPMPYPDPDTELHQ
jgi:hypothetical protein